MNTETAKYLSQYSNVIFCTLCIIIFAGYIFRRLFSKSKNLPPGPISLPIVGYLPFLRKDLHSQFWELSKKYGNIFGFHLGSQYVIVLNNFTVIKDAFNKAEFLGRPKITSFDILDINKSLLNINGKEWEEQRRFMLRQLRDLGYGKSKMELFIQEEIRYFIKKIEEYDENAFDPREILTPSVSNIISAFVFGRRMDYDHPERTFLDRMITEITAFLSQAAIHVFMPWISPILRIFGSSKYKEMFDTSSQFSDYVKKQIKEHKDSFDVNNIRDFIDGFLLQKKQNEIQNIKSTFDDYSLYGNIITLFGAGSETVKTTMEWVFIAMATYPEIQKKVQREIDDAIGRKTEICWMDRMKMPYTRAVLTEVQRWRTVVPTNVMRCTLDDVSLQGFDISKGTLVAANIWAAHNDPEYWENPQKFIPERFLNEDQTDVSISECFIPFSMGKRSCPGAILANMELFLYFASTLQNYNIVFPKGETHSLEGSLGISYQPIKGNLRFLKRK